ncbi:membrane associated rhomboid family serine protease [Luteibacter sp. OK325]|jgi:membrane associated rhomboid family serine protease|uniref:rhomboid family intramembrane serine protease n=1 Tax=Luteibacter sp. OK325 TaxID=2135670 RepID=UPI000D35471E|nr:rhomboid family intramembrane serine protease [Luteibacter sp. OK325]PTR33255.1 membrane associated rhomboid family serine protease [Luteibacter sp. OK325]
MPTNLPPVTRNLLIANVLVFVLQLLLQDDTTLALTKWFALWPVGHDIAVDLGNGNIAGVGFRPWQLITYGFMHGSVMHILLNMYALYMFGGLIERVMGQRRFIIYYFTCLVAASLAQLAIMYSFEPDRIYPTVGASGAIFGLLGAFAMLFPREKLMMIPIPIGIPAWLFVTLYGLAELFFGVTGTLAGVAHFAHLGGLFAGLLLLWAWGVRPPPRRWS